MPVPFRDRTDAGQQLAERLSRHRGRPDVVVLGLPRGGIPVAAEVRCKGHAKLRFAGFIRGYRRIRSHAEAT